MSTQVLLVEDEPLLARSLARLLTARGFQVVIASSAEEALTHLAEHEVAVVLSDHVMPGTTGVELLERCTREYPDVSQLLLTGCADLEMARAAIQRTKVMRLLLKPWEPEELVSAVHEALWRNELVRMAG